MSDPVYVRWLGRAVCMIWLVGRPGQAVNQLDAWSVSSAHKPPLPRQERHGLQLL